MYQRDFDYLGRANMPKCPYLSQNARKKKKGYEEQGEMMRYFTTIKEKLHEHESMHSFYLLLFCLRVITYRYHLVIQEYGALIRHDNVLFCWHIAAQQQGVSLEAVEMRHRNLPVQKVQVVTTSVLENVFWNGAALAAVAPTVCPACDRAGAQAAARGTLFGCRGYVSGCGVCLVDDIEYCGEAHFVEYLN
jgi:hypothetical protein